MFGLFKKKSEADVLRQRYQQLVEEAYQLSHTNRKASDQKMAEADALMSQLEGMKDAKRA